MSKFTGNLPVVMHDNKKWLQHDHSQSWSSGAGIRAALDALAAELDRLVAEETKEAVLDYAQNAEMALGVASNGELLVGVRMANADAHVAVSISFRELVSNAIKEIRPTIGTDPGAQALLSAMISVGKALSQITSPPPDRAQNQQNPSSQLSDPGQQHVNPKRPVRRPPPMAGA
jgi:hypothetical protein